MSGAGSGRAPLVPAWVAGVSPIPEGEPAGRGARTRGEQEGLGRSEVSLGVRDDLGYPRAGLERERVPGRLEFSRGGAGAWPWSELRRGGLVCRGPGEVRGLEDPGGCVPAEVRGRARAPPPLPGLHGAPQPAGGGLGPEESLRTVDPAPGTAPPLVMTVHLSVTPG